MKRYVVRVPVDVVAIYEVMAENVEDAKQLVLGGGGKFDEFDYGNEDIDSNNWEVEVSPWL